MTEACEPTDEEWSSSDVEAAAKEGWTFSTCYREEITLEIQKLDDQNKFESDQAAIQHIRMTAAFGSDLHGRALQLLKKYNPEEFKRRMI